MERSNRWLTVLKFASVLALVDVLIQYLLGLWTNVYAPGPFTDSSSSAALDGHYVNGDILFVLAVVCLVVAALGRHWRLVGPSVGLVVSVLLAGIFGMAYVASTPNSAIDSFAMGVMFLFALFSANALVMLSWTGSRFGRAAAPSAAVPPASS